MTVVPTLVSAAAPPPDPDIQTHTGLSRATHWLTALAMIIMIGSGWRIYDWNPVFSFIVFPSAITFGGNELLSDAVHNEAGLAGALQWHFAAMWVLTMSFLINVVRGFVSGHFRRYFLPLWPHEIRRDLMAALTFRLPHRLGHYNAVQRAAYVGVMAVITVMILSGLAIWKPIQLHWLAWLFGGFDNARIVHFLGMAAIVLFLIVHLALVALVPKTLVAMVIGRASEPVPSAADRAPR